MELLGRHVVAMGLNDRKVKNEREREKEKASFIDTSQVRSRGSRALGFMVLWGEPIDFPSSGKLSLARVAVIALVWSSACLLTASNSDPILLAGDAARADMWLLFAV